MKKSARHQRLRDWWEFQYLYQYLSSSSLQNASHQHLPQCSHHQNYTSQPDSGLPQAQCSSAHIHHSENKNNSNHNRSNNPYRKNNHSHSHSNSLISQPFIESVSKAHQVKMYNSRQNQNKRQREWIYLSHYLTISGLNPIYIISGSDDGREPDFTLVFYHDYRLYYVGVELTTLPRLRDQMGDENLIAKRWYWQSLHQMARLREKERAGNTEDSLIQSYDRFRLPLQTLYMPQSQFSKRPRKQSIITQQDVDEVMGKKAHKVDAYHTRRPLQELWLLVHTDKYQPDSILTTPDHPLLHKSDYDQIHITRYPSHKVINVENSGVVSQP